MIDPFIDRWWLTWREVEPVRTVTLRSLTTDWATLFWSALKNRRSAGAPLAQKTAAKIIQLHRSHVHKLLRGDCPIQLDLLCGLASLVGIELSEFLPKNLVMWIENITMRICSGAVSRDEARAYAHYMWLSPDLTTLGGRSQPSSPNPDVVMMVASQLQQEQGHWDEGRVLAALHRVAICLRGILGHLRLE